MRIGILLSNIKISWRNIKKNASYSLLNIVGLAIGLTCFGLIGYWSLDELSYDDFNENADHIFRVRGQITTGTESFGQAVTNIPLADALLEYYPQIEEAARMDFSDAIVEIDDRQFNEDNILATDPSFLSMFSYDLIVGNAESVLKDPYSIVLTESTAKKYFGNENPVGKTLKMYLYDPEGSGELYKVTGIIADPPRQSHFTFNSLVSMSTMQRAMPFLFGDNGWGNNSFYTYISLKNPADYKEINESLPIFLEMKMPGYTKEIGNLIRLSLQPLTDIYLKSNLRYEIRTNGNLRNIYIVFSIGIFILLLASINYINLATVQSINRAQEVGVKKVFGASKKSLIAQYLTESILISTFSLGFSLILIQAVAPAFNELSGKDMQLMTLPKILGGLALLSLIVGIFAGMYPAFFLSSFRAKQALQRSIHTGKKASYLRESLVVFQFAIALLLVSGIVVIKEQLDFIQNKDLGFDKDNLIAVKVNGSAEVIQNYSAFKSELLQKQSISGVARSNSMIIGGLGNSGLTTVDGNNRPVQSSTYRLFIDESFMEVYNMKLVSGRNFSASEDADTSSFIVNEAAVSTFSWQNPEKALGTQLEIFSIEGPVIGVVEDFNFNTLHHPIEPIVIAKLGSNFSQITVKASFADPAQIIQEIQKVWDEFFPSSFMEYSFIDERLESTYQAESTYASLLQYFTMVALLVACLGLFGLTAFTIQQKTKEISIRKVLGAEMEDILKNLSYNFFKILGISIILAIPIIIFVMNSWLQEFAYRIKIDIWIILKAILLVLMVMVLTIGYQTFQAARQKPADQLRRE